MEIKGLADKVRGARQAISKAREASSGLEKACTEFAMDADALTEQVKKHHDDLKFEASTLGNSSEGSVDSTGQEFQDNIHNAQS